MIRPGYTRRPSLSSIRRVLAPASPIGRLACRLTVLVCFCGTPAASASAQDATPSEVPAPEPSTARDTAGSAAVRGKFDLALLHQPGGLTADQAAIRARRTAPSLRRSRAQQRIVDAGVDRALADVLPRLEVSARYTRLANVQQGGIGGGAANPFADADVLLADVDDPESQQLLRGLVDAFNGFTNFQFPILLNQYAFRGSLSYRLSELFVSALPALQAAKAFTKAEQARIKAAVSDVELRAREAYYEYARARGAHIVAQASVAQTHAQLVRMQALVSAGSSARVDLMRVEALHATAQVAEARARGAVAVTLASLRALLHQPGEEDLPLGEDFNQPLPPVRGTRGALLGRAFKQRPEMKALRQLLKGRENAVSARSGEKLPSLVLSANVDHANPNPRVFPQEEEFRTTWDLNATLSWSPNDWFTGDADVRAAEAEYVQAQSDLSDFEDALRLEVTRAYEDQRTAQRAHEAAQVSLRAAEETYRVRTQQLAAGAAVASDLIDAETELVRGRLDLLNALIDLRVARARLRRAVGGRVDG